MTDREQLRKERDISIKELLAFPRAIDELLVENLNKKVELLEKRNKRLMGWIYMLMAVAAFFFIMWASLFAGLWVGFE